MGKVMRGLSGRMLSGIVVEGGRGREQVIAKGKEEKSGERIAFEGLKGVVGGRERGGGAVGKRKEKRKATERKLK